MEFSELIQLRRSVRGKYEKVQISHDDIVMILKKAQQAPSWKNWQVSRCYVLETKEMLEEFRAKALPDFNQRSSENALLLVTTFVKDVSGFDIDKNPETEIGNMWGAYDLGLHDAYLVLAAKDAGYDTLIMGLRNGAAIREMLNIPENEEVVSVIALGKASEPGKDRKRADLEDVVKFF